MSEPVHMCGLCGYTTDSTAELHDHLHRLNQETREWETTHPDQPGVSDGCGVAVRYEGVTGMYVPARYAAPTHRAFPEAIAAALVDVAEASRGVAAVHVRLIDAVTPGHSGFIYANGPKATPESREAYSSLFSQWHAETRKVRAALDRLDAARSPA